MYSRVLHDIGTCAWRQHGKYCNKDLCYTVHLVMDSINYIMLLQGLRKKPFVLLYG